MADITLISGSTLGGAEYVAEHLAEKLEEAGFTTETLHGPLLEDLSASGIWLIISSTHGAGDIPDNLSPFYEALQEQKPDLSAVRFGAIGIGSREYDTFCGAIDKLEAELKNSGAKQTGETLKINILDHDIPEDPAETVEVMNSIEDPNIKYTYYEKAGIYYSSQGQDAYDKWYDAVSPYWEEVNSVIMDAADLENMGL